MSYSCEPDLSLSFGPYAVVEGFGAAPSIRIPGAGAVGKTAASAVLAEAFPGGAVPPEIATEAALATAIFEAAIAGDETAVVSAINATLTTLATVGATAACAATGVGAALAPVCGFVAGSVTKIVGGMIFGGGETCGAALRRVRDGAYNALVPQVGNDKVAQTELYAAAGRYAERTLGSCALTDNWSMSATIRAEATRMGLALGKGENGIFGFASDAWKTYNNDKFTGEAGAIILAAKVRRWALAAKVARALAEKEYAQLQSICDPVVPGRPPRIRVPGGGKTACEEKAWSTAVSIAASSYLFQVVDGAPAILGTQSEATRRMFIAEVAQDRAIAGLAANVAEQKAFQEATARLQTSQALLASVPGGNVLTARSDARRLIGVGLLALAAVTGIAIVAKAREARR